MLPAHPCSCAKEPEATIPADAAIQSRSRSCECLEGVPASVMSGLGALDDRSNGIRRVESTIGVGHPRIVAETQLTESHALRFLRAVREDTAVRCLVVDNHCVRTNHAEMSGSR